MALGKCAVAVGLLAIVGALNPAAAKITQYECKFPYEAARGGGWIPEILILTDDDVKGEIMVFDPIIKHFVGNPIDARLSGRTKVRSTYTWELVFRNKGQGGRMIYTFSYFSNGQPAKMKGEPGGYRGNWSAEGTCKVSKG
ncbi:hypothetical protein [Tabrizicola sp.]|jgi:hypothetical protein|uniref:hypothetical protein n=1 Tax=Tabrizicola sp. TaxID=2005166 RepID=UPI001A53735A|nr:hypothetical protein [Tabrizicola sp.]MBL9064349.1 hypothetical protein [Tabrizicola sp.]